MRHISILLIFICGSAAQYYESPSDGYPGSSVLADPIRRALGLWGRLLNRMAQPNAPSDEQLRLQTIREGNEFEALRNNENFFGTGQNRFPLFSGGSLGSSGALPNGIDVGSSKIIDEKKLLELLPRLRETTTQSTTTISEATTTPEGSTTTTKTEIEKKKKKKNKKSDTASHKKKEENDEDDSEAEDNTSATIDEEEDEEITVPPKTKKTKKSNKKKTNEKTDSNKESKDNKSNLKDNSTVSELSSTTQDNKVESSTTTTTTTKSLETVKKEAEELISEIEDVLSEEQWILSTNSSESKTTVSSEKSKAEVKSSNKTTNTEDKKEKTDSASSKKLENVSTKEILLNNKNTTEVNLSNSDNTTESQSSTVVSENNTDNDLLEDGSGEEPISTITTTKGTTPKPKNKKKKSSARTTIAQTTTTITTESSPVQHEEQKDYDEDDDDDDEELKQYKNFTKIKVESESTTSKPAPRPALRNSSKHKKNKNTQTAGIPEAEEEDLKSANNTQPQLDSAAISAAAAAGSAAGPSASLKSAANSLTSFASAIDPISSVVPVKYANSIIDGIGPLILPILGYSRRAVSQFMPRRTQGVASYQPGKLQNNYDQYGGQQQILSQPEQTYQKYFPSNYYSQNQQRIVTPSFRSETLQQNNKFLANSGLPIHSPTQLSNSNGQQLVPINSGNVKMSAQELDSDHFRFASNPDLAVPSPPNLVDRIINAETATLGNSVHPRFMPTPSPTIFASDAYRQAISSYLNQPKVGLPTTQNIATSAFRQMYEMNNQKAQTLLNQGEMLNSNGNSGNGIIQQRKPAAALNPSDPGYDQGRSNVVNTFYEDSGVMVNDQSSAPDSGTSVQNNNVFAPPPRASSSGFGGGRRPDVSFDDEPRSSFLLSK